jgi:hypothetical protein
MLLLQLNRKRSQGRRERSGKRLMKRLLKIWKHRQRRGGEKEEGDSSLERRGRGLLGSRRTKLLLSNEK